MPQLNLSEQEVVQPLSKEYHTFAHSRPWKEGLVPAGKSVWPEWPLGDVVGTSSDPSETAPGLEFLADVATCFLGRAERSTRDAPRVCADSRMREGSLLQKEDVELAEQRESKDTSPEGDYGTEANKDKQVGTRSTNIPGNKWKTCQDCGEMIRDWSQSSQRPTKEKITCADVGRLCTSLKATCGPCTQPPSESKKRQKPFSIFSDSASSRLPDGFLVEIKFRPGTIEGLGLGPPWMSIWGCCQQCRLIRTMDRRDRVDEFLLEHQSHNSHWKDMQIGHFDFRIEERIRELYKIFCEASRNRLLAYTTCDKYIPTKVIHPDLHPGLQEKIHHLESLLRSGTETRMELETTAGIYCKRKRLTQSTLEKRAQKKIEQISNGIAPSVHEQRSEENSLLGDQKAIEIASQWPQGDNYKSVEPLLSPPLPQGIHLPFPSFADEISQPANTNQSYHESLKCAEEYNQGHHSNDHRENDHGASLRTQEDPLSNCEEGLNEQEDPISSSNQVLGADGADFGLNLFDWQASVSENCLRGNSEGHSQDAAGEDHHTSSTTSMDYPLDPRENTG